MELIVAVILAISVANGIALVAAFVAMARGR